ncbi:MAG: hypothetical protein GX624_05780 [Actinobacteria bacterium]|nr:hypothetical protein [Actinomycetota bacterium]
MRRVLTLLALGLTLAWASGVLAACDDGASVAGSGSPSAGRGSVATTTYADAQYGFSITYPDELDQAEPAEGTDAGGDSVLDVVFADEDGPVIADRSVNAVQVSVYELAREVDDAEVPDLEGELQGVVDELMGSLRDSAVVGPLSGTEVNGLPGFVLTYTYVEEGTAITAMSFFLFAGRHEYQITAQSATADWETMKDGFEAAAGSFTVR